VGKELYPQICPIRNFRDMGYLGRKLTGCGIIGGKLVRYGILRSDKTGYREGKAFIFEIRIKRI